MVLTDDLVYLEKGDWPLHRELKARANRAGRSHVSEHQRNTCGVHPVKLLGWVFLAASLGLLYVGIFHSHSLQSLHSVAGDGLADYWDGVFGDAVMHDVFSESSKGTDDLCPQQPAFKLKDTAFTFTEPSAALQASRLSGAIQVDTSVQDEYPPFNDNPELWKGIFDPLADYLERTFPLIHAPQGPVTREKVGGVGLLYTWPGSDPSLKPLILAAHQDVVPVDSKTVDQWTYPPFSGFYDEKTGLVWGRGASDDKSSLVALLTAFESLLEARDTEGNPWVPKRTVVLSFGADEEASGRIAFELAKHLVGVYGEKGAYMMVDEGGPVVPASESPFNRTLAVVATAEKGYLDARITVHAPGGHSSEPPAHTAIGHLASLITLIEGRPYKATLGVDNPAFTMLGCLTTSDSVAPGLKKAMKELRHALKKKNSKSRREQKHLEKLKQKVLDLAGEDVGLSFVTSQAVDLISAGVKVNALPEEATAVINHRIEISSSVADIREHIATTLRDYAEQNDIELDGWGNATLSYTPKNKNSIMDNENDETFLQQVSAQTTMHNKRSWSHLRNTTMTSVHTAAKPMLRIVLSDAFESALEPAPQTPLEGEGSEPWKLLQGVIRTSYSDQDIVIVPDLMGGNTDTKSYWNLTDAIFRFSPGSPNPTPGGLSDGIHTVNEFAPADALVYGWRVWISLIRAVAE
ncbi:unnamed protein product [Tilletia laevis]|uniref:Peptidase M20 dimerisation domain-containing protein n=3 Tax=Tilletia TaxID=13289 RepID=A0A8X7SYZ0_9BASI|nr:hypothetical protein CF336_g2203 [Tilletia laevis]KAE8202760.1 hypothetical protein CF328_g2034 [Tilletia controversa]KAE8263998.1 hypothetical protein A4X03_0g1269 [Tilletia caries]KAE8207037.1 hypothetical protein CF335_g1445 [Tilletia laevis]KAE8252918.1 hypothetical protein A4X06_0g1828 [Tilletia controversa]